MVKRIFDWLKAFSQVQGHSYVYVFVREDISAPQIAVQSCHACIEATKAFKLDRLSDHPSVIILSAKNETKLHRVRKYLIEQGVRHVHFYEPDIEDELTALATEPIFGDRREIFRKYQLLNNEPDAHHTRYALKYPDGYYHWRGDCASSHRTHLIQHADLYSCESEAKGWHKDATKVVPVKVCYHVGKGGAV